MTAAQTIEIHAQTAIACAKAQNWEAARQVLALAATYLLPLQLENIEQPDCDAVVNAWGAFQAATEEVAERYSNAFPKSDHLTPHEVYRKDAARGNDDRR